jgi:hypothetical protein
MPYEADPRVDAYISALPEWQQEICRHVRSLVHAADPQVAESIKRTRQPYFVLDGNICALLAAKDHVNVFLYDGGIVPDPERHHHGRARQQDSANRGLSKGRPNQRCSLDGDVQADHRQQSGWRLAKGQAARLTAWRRLRGIAST